MSKGRVPYSEELAYEICDSIRSSSLGLRKLCVANPHWPPKTTILSWRSLHPFFADLYARAKADQIEVFVDEIIEIADDDTRDTIIKTDSKGNEYEACNNEWLNRSRLRIDTRKWLAAKLAPKLYGDSKQSDNDDGKDFITKNRDKLNNK